jgi:hypothetical protein
MAQRVVTLSASKAGMTRLRYKGGASPETLYELTNGFINASRCPQQRPGTRWKFNLADTGHTGNAGKTKGLVAFKGVFYSFTHSPSYTTTGSSSYVVVVLRHPTSSTATIAAIHFAQPFMGLLYVVVQFSATSDYPSGFIGHYWLQNPPAWKQFSQYMDNALVQPGTPNGYYYEAHRSINPSSWTALLQYKVGDKVQPTTYNGSYFTVNNVYGPGAALTPPIARSGGTEPDWTLAGLQNGAFTLEFSTANPLPTPATGTTPPGATPPGIEDGGRYSNRRGVTP